MMSRIFFVASAGNVNCQIYSDSGILLAEHLMTTQGARVRCTDLDAAIDEAQWREELDAVIEVATKPV